MLAGRTQYNQDFLCMFQQPADRLFSIELLDEMNRF